MTRRQKTGMHVKGWYVEAVLDDAENQRAPKRVTRLFAVRASAAQYADMLRAQVKQPSHVNVVPSYSRAKIDERIAAAAV